MGVQIVGLDELNQFGVELGKIASKALPEVDAVLEKGSLNIKEDLVAGAKSSKHFKGLAPAISYDSEYGAGSVAYAIGPDKARKGGGIGNVAYFGTSRGGGTLDLEGPLMREAPKTYEQINKLVDGWVDKL
ncbi:hypothetical protein [Paeniglutamicibacter terrestris]|uniref:HK97 gp10 family phage protein n=1 Tax=Paeniglutamicibacter terrestris TaxID=2723403 RepID=A0ABX1G859_9MICC|nr:hypothetical protein [Paeniglutamicibacter terrestris]NKG22209.1 hypothetical protein [Paeniglutamicibacter terrestris]